MGVHKHRAQGIYRLRAAVLTVSSTRDLETDESGRWIKSALEKDGHQVADHRVAPDNVEAIADAVREIIAASDPHALIVNGGTGVTPKDVTIEAIKPLFVKELTAFSVLFAQISFETVDTAAMLSRATAGVVGRTALFAIPGSLKACKQACRELIFPELGHLAGHVRGV